MGPARVCGMADGQVQHYPIWVIWGFPNIRGTFGGPSLQDCSMLVSVLATPVPPI